MQEEEARKPELVDQLQLVLEPRPRLVPKPVALRIAILEGPIADSRELDDRRFRAVGEVGIAIAELLCEVELQPLGELDRARDGLAVLWEAVDDLGR